MGELPQAGRMRLRVRAHHVEERTALRRVLVSTALTRTSITPLLWHHSGAVFSCRADLLRLGALFRVAATGPHSAVFLPLRANPPSDSAASWADQLRPRHDLVLARDDVQLRPSAWPRLRDRLRRNGNPLTLRAPAPRPIQVRADWERDELNAAEHAATVFLTGSPQCLLDAGDELTRCADEVATSADVHRFGGPAAFSQFNGPDPDPGERRDGSWECMVLAEDQHFRRRPAR